MRKLRAFSISRAMSKLRKKQESFDALALIRKVEKAGYKVRRLEVLGPFEPGGQPMFDIAFDPVMPRARLPVERIIEKMGLQVEGGGTLCMVQPPERRGKGKPKRRFEMSESDVSFMFKGTFGKEPADVAVDIVRHLESELKDARRDRFSGFVGRKPRRRRIAR